MGDAYREAARESGRTPHVTAIRFWWSAESLEDAVRDFGATAIDMVRTLWTYGAITDMPGVTDADQITLDDLMRDRMIFGTPDECRSAIAEYRATAGVDDILLIFRHPSGPTQDRVLAAMEMFAAEVIGTGVDPDRP